MASITRANQPEGEKDVRGMSLRESTTMGHKRDGKIDVRGMSQRGLIMRKSACGNGLTGNELGGR